MGDLVAPGPSAVVYTFTAPFSDTVINVGDVSEKLPCRLKAGDRDLPCHLGISVLSSGKIVMAGGGRITSDSLGTALVELRPLDTRLPTDTIFRIARVRAVVPKMVWGIPGTEDTLRGAGEQRMLLALPVTRAGRVIMGVPITWVQDSGAAVAELVPGRTGWVRALASGVAVFRAVGDTATATRRVVVEIPPAAATGARP